ncbi:MAG: TraR/DksA family transcriptional regulator [Actinobacteria bacterium]|nr:TraR/DksA family transcriptional regulator [Actinomycetota bacterium]NCW34420.1 TraR/DksA family transcriptional regulator [Actinomycetota bacterium]NCZ73097.1 TraR/DksA family transcriptional regulator [Actinomycetota bacterium]NDA41003.1 TraR/DksA family transcriptional regulator [Actinomycetota bacterium]NDB30829.1 TraR/DksA family transcriptional regulator [Actinomycetota bacterium]
MKKKLSKAVARFAGKKSSAKSKPVAKKVVAKKSPAKKPAAKKAPAKKAAAKKVTPAKKIAPAKKVAPAKKLPPKKPQAAIIKGAHKTALTSSTAKGGATTISVYKPEIEASDVVVVEEKRLVLPPPVRKPKPGKKPQSLKPIKAAPAPLIVTEGAETWTATELKSIRSELAKDLVRLKKELEEVESEMDALIEASGVGAGDDQADAGAKTFEREHEMSLVYNARDMVLQTERALERIDNKSYGRCEDCGHSIGKARLQVFPRATLCMLCKQKEERR